MNDVTDGHGTDYFNATRLAKASPIHPDTKVNVGTAGAPLELILDHPPPHLYCFRAGPHRAR